MRLIDRFQRRQYLQPYALGGIVALIGCLSYLGMLTNGFVNWDDDLYIYENRSIRSLGPASLLQFITRFHAGNWHPVTWLSHALDYAVWGLNPFGHHLSSLILHGLNTALVVLIIHLLLQIAVRQKQRTDRQAFLRRDLLVAAAMTGLLFGLHPIHVESVAWASERKDLLSAFFYLQSLLLYLRYATDERAALAGSSLWWKDRRFYAVLLLFACALMSKAMAVTLPLVLLLLDWYPLSRFRTGGHNGAVLIEKIPFFLLSGITAIITFFAQRSARYVVMLEDFPLWDRVVVSFYGLTAYIGKLLWPQGLIPFYPMPSHISIAEPEFLLPVIFVLVVSIVCLLLMRKQRFWSASWGYFCITLLPVLGIVKTGMQVIADRYVYLASIAPLMLAGLCFALFLKVSLDRRQPAFSAVIVFTALLIISLSAFLTMRQVRVWKDGVSFWSSILSQNRADNKTELLPEQRLYSGPLTRADAWMVTAHHNRAKAYADARQYPEAEQDLNIAVAMGNAIAGYPNEINLFYRGYVFLKADRLAEALRDFSGAIALKQDYAEAYYLRGVAYMNSGKTAESIEDITRAMAVSASPPYNYYHDRGLAFARIGRHDSAVADYSEALRQNPVSKRTYLSRARSYYSLNLFQEAEADLKKAQALP